MLTSYEFPAAPHGHVPAHPYRWPEPASAHGRIATTQAGRYLAQLFRFWNRHVITFSQAGLSVQFLNAWGRLEPRPTELVALIEAEDDGTLEHAKTVLTAHLNTIAGEKPPLAFSWQLA